jgi:VanZ family protein
MSSSVAPPPAAGSAIQTRGGFGHWASAWVPVILCIGVIAIESTTAFGADHTSGPLQHFCEFLFHRHFTQPEWWRLHILIRKGGHFTGYGIQSVAWFRAFWMTWRSGNPNRSQIAVHGLAMLGTFFIACCDEFHQTFLPNRSGSFIDVMTDCSGALLLQLLIWFWIRSRAERP